MTALTKRRDPLPMTTLGVCYYPEHWPRERWQTDAAAMAELGLGLVRIGEFAWSRIEPEAGRYYWAWLDEAVATLADAGLQVIMGTPTACPPKWLVDKYPEVLPLDEHGRVRRFGSRRHYCFGSTIYRAEAARITEAVAQRYGSNPAITGWQLDNEYGCHNTTPVLSADGLSAFRAWLRERYGDIDALNTAWGTVFWSQEYRRFSEIDFPYATVTEANPAHRLDHWRFSSAQVAEFNREQAGIVRAHAHADAWITHNFMGNFIDFDHYALGVDIDVASWDSYPLGFLDVGWFTDKDKQTYRQTGHPDWTAFHHDLYRGVCDGRFGVMEQQPGPVNWAANNAAPLAGMVRLWTLEAIAHGAEFVSYFRWRQVPFAQEQMHAGLLLRDATAAPALPEVERVVRELREPLLELAMRDQADASRVALVMDYEALAMLAIQPHGEAAEPLLAAFEWYSACRRLGLDIDIVPRSHDLSAYRLVLIPCLPNLDAALVAKLDDSDARIVVGARSGSRTRDMQLPAELAPGPLQQLMPLKVAAVDALRPGCTPAVNLSEELDNLAIGHAQRWLETVHTTLPPRAVSDDGRGVWFSHNRVDYLAAQGDAALLLHVLGHACSAAGIDTTVLPGGLRLRRRGTLQFAFNYGPDVATVAQHADEFLLGRRELHPGEVAVWQPGP